MTVSYLVATTGRPGLDATLQSITCQQMPGDQVLVIGGTPDIARTAEKHGCSFWYCPPGNDWGHTERNDAMARGAAYGDYIAHLDDDDVAVMGSRVAMETAFTQHPGAPFIFKMFYPGSGHMLWSEQRICTGNVGTPMFVVPNIPKKLGRFAPVYGGDFNFIMGCQWPASAYVWVDSVIARIRPC